MSSSGRMGGSMGLAKITLEEAYKHPDEVAHLLGSDEALRRVASAAGLEPAWYRDVLRRLADFDDARLADMDANDIEHSIVSLTAPGIQAITDPTTAVSEARRQNDFLAERISRHPDRFSGFAALPMQDPGNAVAELTRSVRSLGFKGALINGYTSVGDGEQGSYLDEPVYQEFWAAVADLNIPIYLHPRPGLPGTQLAIAGHPQLLGATWGFGTETATHLLRLIFSGLFDRHPGLRLIVGHLGEGLPALLWRTQHNFELNPFDKKIEKPLAEYFADNILLTTSGNFSDQALINAILTVGSDNIMFSVDYPYADNASAARWIENAPISENDRRKIAHGNARRLFNLS